MNCRWVRWSSRAANLGGPLSPRRHFWHAGDPIALLAEELKSINSELRLEAVGRLRTVALAIGNARVRKELIPFIKGPQPQENTPIPPLPRQCHRHPASPSGRQLRRSQRQRARINHRSQSSCYFAGVSEFMEQDDEVLHRLAIELGQMVDVVGVQLPPIDGLARASSRLWRPES